MEANIVDRYLEKVREALERIRKEQTGNILAAGGIVADSIKNDGLMHLFGTGHSHMVALEAYSRAGGLAPVNPILEDNLMLHQGTRRSGAMERLEGYAAVIIALNDLTKNDCLFVISNSGRNAVPVEMAAEAVKRKIPVIAITSLTHSRSVTSRHSSGKRLFEVAPLVIDNCAPDGDACLEIEGVPALTGPLSTITGSFIINSIVAVAVEKLAASGVTPPVFISGNAEDGELHNYNLYLKYKNRVKF